MTKRCDMHMYGIERCTRFMCFIISLSFALPFLEVRHSLFYKMKSNLIGLALALAITMVTSQTNEEFIIMNDGLEVCSTVFNRSYH